ncbi:DNA-processing protein DprA [bacterium]|nr:DNA-processing protein DprA [bacterium]
MNNELISWLKLELVYGLGLMTRLKLFKECGSAEDILKLSDEYLRVGFKIEPQVISKLRNNDKLVDKEINLIKSKNVKLVPITSEDYPDILRTIPDPPCLLYVLGNEKKLKDEMIAIVGTRMASIYARESACKLGRDFSNYGWTVVSGFARGVDTEAHKGAMEGDAGTVAVIGSGINQLYPNENMDLSKEVIEKGGAVVSEFSMNTAPDKWTFPKRNRIISALAQKGVVIIEAALKSGSLITAKYAKKYGREIFVVPGNILTHNSQGSNKLIKDGAKLIDSVSDVIGQKIEDEIKDKNNLDKNEKIVVGFLDFNPVSIDVLAGEAVKKGLTLPILMSILMKLEIKGHIRQVPGKRYIIRS